MRTPHVLLAVSLFSFALAVKADCVKGVGEVVKKSLSVDAFHGISLQGSMDVVDIAGSGDVVLDASQSLEASVAGSGDVSYTGTPARISRNVMGSGEVRWLERGPR